MKISLLYYRIYYTIKRGLLWLGNDKNDSPRFTATLILSLFTFFNFLTVVMFLFITIKNKFNINNIVGVILLFGFLALNWFVVNKKRGKEVEYKLSEDWEKEWNKNLLLTVSYLILSILFIGLSFYYAHKYPIADK